MHLHFDELEVQYFFLLTPSPKKVSRTVCRAVCREDMYGRYHIPEIESVKFFPQKNFALKVGRGGAGGAPGDMHVEK